VKGQERLRELIIFIRVALINLHQLRMVRKTVLKQIEKGGDKNIKTIAIIVVMLCFGCASTGTGNQRIMNADFMDNIKVGVKTKEDVLALLGPPMSWFDPVWRYEGTDRIISPLCYIPIIDLTARQTIRSRTVEIYFDGGVVSDVRVGHGTEKRMYAVGTVSLIFAGLGAVSAAGQTPYAPYYANGHYYPGQAIANTIPTGGGGSMTTIKYYK
jgi:hypothetical protein